ncbi:anion transporter [Babesia caballi]|uniref:Anion transporter n=1 Tax=Babesia caballi TaxID=5871 RepID=A0AAV4LSK7_BABCB|nr:anion transporter [Babesia caballi]
MDIVVCVENNGAAKVAGQRSRALLRLAVLAELQNAERVALRAEQKNAAVLAEVLALLGVVRNAHEDPHVKVGAARYERFHDALIFGGGGCDGVEQYTQRELVAKGRLDAGAAVLVKGDERVVAAESGHVRRGHEERPAALDAANGGIEEDGRRGVGVDVDDVDDVAIAGPVVAALADGDYVQKLLDGAVVVVDGAERLRGREAARDLLDVPVHEHQAQHVGGRGQQLGQLVAVGAHGAVPGRRYAIEVAVQRYGLGRIAVEVVDVDVVDVVSQFLEVPDAPDA